MTIENGTAIVLAYVFVSMGVIIAFLLAARLAKFSKKHEPICGPYG